VPGGLAHVTAVSAALATLGPEDIARMEQVKDQQRRLAMIRKEDEERRKRIKEAEMTRIRQMEEAMER